MKVRAATSEITSEMCPAAFQGSKTVFEPKKAQKKNKSVLEFGFIDTPPCDTMLRRRFHQGRFHKGQANETSTIHNSQLDKNTARFFLNSALRLVFVDAL